MAAISARAAARQAPALCVTLLASMEHQRAAGAWHAEWRPLRELLISTGSAVAWLRDCLEHLEVDPQRMRANLAAGGGAPLAEAVSPRARRARGGGVSGARADAPRSRA